MKIKMHFTNMKAQDITGAMIVGDGFGPLPLPVVLYADGTALSLTTLREDPSMDELQREVGGVVDIVTLPAMPDLLMAFDVSGKLKGKPRNRFATEILGVEVVGDVVILLNPFKESENE